MPVHESPAQESGIRRFDIVIARRAVALTALALLLAAPAMAQLKPLFTDNLVTDSFPFAIEATAGDIDGDGDVDLIGANDMLPGEENSSIVWWDNEAGDGSIWTQRTIVAQFNGARTLHAVDMDRDGDLDVLAGGLSADAVRWWENTNGNGLVWTEHSVVEGLDGVTSVTAGDIDGDGDVDIANGAFFAGGVRWFENVDGGGITWTEHTINFSYDAPRSVQIADIDGDGDADVAACSELEDEVTWWKNLDGVGGSWAEIAIETGIDAPNTVRIGDIDRDGDADVVSTAGQQDAIYWWANIDGEGNTWVGMEVDDTIDLPNSLQILDMDADGDYDLLGTGALGDRVRWWENLDGAGVTWTNRTVDTDLDGAASAVDADLNGDGLPDIVAVSTLGDGVVWYQNGAIHRRAEFREATIVSGAASDAHEVFPVDVDRDGDLDLLVASGGDDTIYYYETLAVDPPAFLQRTVTDVADGATGVWAGDVDGDGDVDVISASVLDNAVRWYENDGDTPPNFFRRDLTNTATQAVSVTAGDLDGDGDLDILSASRADDHIRWFENDGNVPPVFLEQTVSTAGDSPRAVRVADIDGDGDLDAVSASRNDDTVRWHENNGDTPPTFTDRVVSANATGARGVSVADMDADGDLDVVAALDIGDAVHWYENDGGAPPVFTERVLPGVIDGAISVDAKDLDADGDVDILAAARASGEILRFENLGGSPPVFVRTVVADGLNLVESVVAADIDHDGDPDAVSSTLSSYRLAYQENCGGQYSAEATSTAGRTQAEGTGDDVLAIVFTHNGFATDLDLEVTGFEFLFEESPGDVLTTLEANEFIDRLEIHRDDGSGVYEPGTDLLVGQVLFLQLTNGRLSFGGGGGNPDFIIAPQTSATFFVVPVLRPDAALEAVHQFRITHLAADGGPQPSVVTSGFPTPLSLQCGEDVATPIVVASAYELTTAGTCPGPVQVSVSGADPNASLGILVSPTDGSFQKPQPNCEGLEIGLDQPTFIRTVLTDVNGEATLNPTLNETQCQLFLQMADLATCRVSNVDQLP